MKRLLSAVLIGLSFGASAEVSQQNINYPLNGAERNLISASAEGNANRVTNFVSQLKGQSNQANTLEGYIIALNSALDRGDQRGLDIASTLLSEMYDPAILSNVSQYSVELGSLYVKLANYSDDPAIQQSVNFVVLQQLTNLPINGAIDTTKLVEAYLLALDGTQAGLDTASFISIPLSEPSQHQNFTGPNSEIPELLGDAVIKLVSYSDDPNLQQLVNSIALPMLTSSPFGEATDTTKLVEALLVALDGTQIGLDTANSILFALTNPPHVQNFTAPNSEIPELLGDAVIKLVNYSDDPNLQQQVNFIALPMLTSSPFVEVTDTTKLLEALLVALDGTQIGLDTANGILFGLSNSLYQHNFNAPDSEIPELLGDAVIKLANYSDDPNLQQQVNFIALPMLTSSPFVSEIDTTKLAEALLIALDGTQTGLDTASGILFALTFPTHEQDFNAPDSVIPDLFGDIVIKLANYSDDPNLQQQVSLILLPQFTNPIFSEATDTTKFVEALLTALDGTQTGLDTASGIMFAVTNPPHQQNLVFPENQTFLDLVAINLVSFDYDIYSSTNVLQGIVNYLSPAAKIRALTIAQAFNNQQAVNILN